RAFGSAFMTAIEPIMPVLQPVIDGIGWLWEKFSNLLGPIDASSESWANLGTTAGKFAGDLLTAIVTLPGKIIELAGKMIEAGKELMRALLQGVKDGAKAVLEYVKSIGSNIASSIKGAASGAWGRLKGAVGLGGG